MGVRKNDGSRENFLKKNMIFAWRCQAFTQYNRLMDLAQEGCMKNTYKQYVQKDVQNLVMHANYARKPRNTIQIHLFYRRKPFCQFLQNLQIRQPKHLIPKNYSKTRNLPIKMKQCCYKKWLVKIQKTSKNSKKNFKRFKRFKKLQNNFKTFESKTTSIVKYQLKLLKTETQKTGNCSPATFYLNRSIDPPPRISWIEQFS